MQDFEIAFIDPFNSRNVSYMQGCVAQLVEQRSPKPPVGGSIPSALVNRIMG